MTVPVNEWCKVLIVDDEVLIRQGIKHYINWEQEGFQIVGEAANGREALDMIEKLDPHIVITDIVMPMMDGEELTRAIKKDYPNIEVIVLSSFGDFDYVRSTFQSGVADYILKPKLDGPELKKALQQAAKKFPFFTTGKNSKDTIPTIEQMIEKLISGYEIDHPLETITEVFPYSHFCLLGINGTKSRQLEEDAEKNLKLHLKDISIHPVATTDLDITYLLNFNIDKLPSIHESIKVMSTSDREIGWIVSEPFTLITDLKIYYDQLLKMIQYHFYLQNNSVLIYDELPSQLANGNNPFNLNRFTEDFKREQFDSAFDYLEKHVDDLSRQYTMDVFEFKSFLGNIIFNITVLLGNMDYDNEALEKEKYSYFASINDATHVKEATALLHSFLAEANTIITSKSNDISHPNMRKLLDYIERHYAESISLSEMAKHFHFNPSYLSTFFNTHNKEGFSEYLNRIRIEKSVELLEKGTVSISEISGMVGYSDHSYFTKVFKKMMGISPSSYRKRFFT
ncbi:response regulator transcription factor [Lederbergia citrea]|uniref:response regulator transcription factor n=1 Tax=Lederbergia citrea TaxID=2833581 RepID=UPI00201605F4|nr:response regulator transcription factor [Lederbergia citrea]